MAGQPKTSANREQREGVEVLVLRAGGTRAEIVPEWGNNCIVFETGNGPVLERVSFGVVREKPSSYGMPILFPFPNRVSDGVLRFRGARHAVDPPRHGFVRQRPWKVETVGASELEGAFARVSFDARDFGDDILGQFPYPFVLEVVWRLAPARLTMETLVRAIGTAPLPFGLGFHPYFHLPAKAGLRVPARERWELRDSLPTGKVVPVEGQYDLRVARDPAALGLDDVFTGLEPDDDGFARSVLRDEETGREIVIAASAADFPEIVVYNVPAPRRAICIEPYTGPTDLFELTERGLDAHLVVLEPGEERRYTVGFEVR